MVTKRHKVFISYHHDADQVYAEKVRSLAGDAIIDKSIYDDISHLRTETILEKIRLDHLADSTVTVVLIGEHTWGRKWVDWEVYASLRPYAGRTRNGLVGIYLPGHSKRHFRFTDNLRSGYALALRWDEVERRLADTVHTAWNRRARPELINNTRGLRENNAPLVPKQYASGYAPTPPALSTSFRGPSQPVQTSGCFIATAAYGTPYAYEVTLLRRWRDERLVKSSFGKMLTSLYYKVSPPVADYVRSRDWSKRLIRRMVAAFCLLVGPPY